MDAVTHAAVITSGVVGLGGAGAAFWSTHRTAQTAREGRVQQRLVESYLEVLRLVELEAQWAKELEWNNKSTEVGIAAGRRLDNVSKWISYSIPTTKAHVTNLKIAAEEVYPGLENRVRVPEQSAVNSRAVAAHLAAFGSAHVGTLYRAWREWMTAVEDEHSNLDFYLRESLLGHGPIEIDKLKRMLDELLPEEAAARKLMAEAMAKDLGHR